MAGGGTAVALQAAKVAAKQAVKASARIAARMATRAAAQAAKTAARTASRQVAKVATQAARTAARNAARVAARQGARLGNAIARRGVAGSLKHVGMRALARSPKALKAFKATQNVVSKTNSALDKAAKLAAVAGTSIAVAKASGKLTPEQEARLDKIDKQLKKDAVTINGKEVPLSQIKASLDATEKGMAQAEP